MPASKSKIDPRNKPQMASRAAAKSVGTSQNKQKKIEVEGKVVEVLLNSEYIVEIEHMGYKHRLKAYPSGKVRTRYKGPIGLHDTLRVEIDLVDISQGRIISKINKYKKYN